ncbi:MAG: hypothetical protein DMD63_12815 [Gemmatimonadetes bacterium]|nr:MAG: hypothetical protein DMD63_12815 [Gemmatimonadota bacterium]
MPRDHEQDRFHRALSALDAKTYPRAARGRLHRDDGIAAVLGQIWSGECAAAARASRWSRRGPSVPPAADAALGREIRSPLLRSAWWRQEDLGAVVTEFGLEPLSIVGYSWGAMLGLLYAIEQRRNPQLRALHRMALIDPAPLTREYRRQFEAEFARRQASPEIQKLRDELTASGLRERDPEAYRQRAFELGVAGYFSDPHKATDLTPFRVVARVQDSVWESLGNFNLIRDLEGMRMPSIVIHGRDDPIPLASSSEAARALGTTFVVLDECGHVPYVEQPAKLFAALDPFLEETNPPVRR